MDIFAGSLMSSPVRTVTPDTSVREAARVMRENDIGSVVVASAEGDIEGILTSTDFVTIVASGDAPDDRAVSEYMSSPVITTTANENIRDVADRLVTYGCHHLPVVDDDEGVIGMITTTDLTAYLSHVEEPSPA